MKKIKDLKLGDYFTRKNLVEPTEKEVYVRGEYDRNTKCYSCYKFYDVNQERFFKGNKDVYTDFIF